MTKKNYKILLLLFNFLVLSLGFGQFDLYIGFSLKPYMIVCAISFLFLMIIRKDKIEKLLSFEKYIMIFTFISILTIFQFRYVDSVIRYILGFSLILMCYFVIRKILLILDKYDIEKVISTSGILISLVTLLFYLVGLSSLNFNFYGNAIKSCGVLIDRNIPRLIGTASNDPNITAFYMTLFFMFYVTNCKTKMNKLGLILTFLIIILTFSMGAYLSISAGLLIMFFNLIGKKLIFKIKLILKVALILVITIFISNIFFNFNLVEIAINRFEAIDIDGGSGRTLLWSNALITFYEHPIFGIGINSSLEYNAVNYGTNHYIHNTFLEVLSETGFIGMMAYGLFILRLIFESKKIYINDKGTLYIFGSIVAMIIQMFFLSVLLQEVFFFVVAILYSYCKKYKDSCNVKQYNMLNNDKLRW